MIKQIITAAKLFLMLTLLTGIIYPLFITLIAQSAFPDKASGSLIMKVDKIAGSELIGQKFVSDKYFWPRPSAIDYNPTPSGASNYSQTSSALKKNYDDKKKDFSAKNFINSSANIPQEMLFSSASGVDPHISPEAAFMQAERIVKARNFNTVQKNKLNLLINNMTQKPQLGFLGKPIINILLLNLQLDNIE